jgi:hypothetical protein
MIFETRGKYKGLAFVKQLLGEKAIYKVAVHNGWSSYW